MRTQRWQDWVMLVLGIWLFLSPFWLTGYASTQSVAAWNSYVFGVLVAGFAWAALANQRRWEEWVELVLGIWLIISPFVLGFYRAEYGAAWNQIVLGVLIAADAAWVLAAYRGERVRV
ncbi:MAG: SPW repeat protein [Sulfurifustis sp.]